MSLSLTQAQHRLGLGSRPATIAYIRKYEALTGREVLHVKGEGKCKRYHIDEKQFAASFGQDYDLIELAKTVRDRVLEFEAMVTGLEYRQEKIDNALTSLEKRMARMEQELKYIRSRVDDAMTRRSAVPHR